jgi:uncharacterized membrane protein YeaQ/YmgE (transglycosylase-associated protein family)
MHTGFVLAGFIPSLGGLFSNCFSYLLIGVIAGTVATFVVRGKLGCILGNFLLGILGAVVGYFALNLIPILNQKDIRINFIGTTIIASVTATLIAFIFSEALAAERRHQQRLLDKYHNQPPQS